VVSETEALWEVTEHGAVFIERRPERATGHAMHVLFVGGLEERVAAISERGIEPVDQEIYGNGVRKFRYRDPEGNEIGIGGVPG
jgi:hypothetical protein